MGGFLLYREVEAGADGTQVACAPARGSWDQLAVRQLRRFSEQAVTSLPSSLKSPYCSWGVPCSIDFENWGEEKWARAPPREGIWP